MPQIGDAKVLGVEVLAPETAFHPRRAPAHRVLDLLFQVHDRIRAHQFSSLVGQVASDAARSGGDSVGKRGSGIRFPSRRNPAPVSASAKAPPHQVVSGDVPSSTPPTAGPRATPNMKLSW